MQIKLPKIQLTKTVKIVAAVVIGLIAISLFMRHCSEPKNDYVTEVTTEVENPYKVKYLKDSIQYIQAEARLVESQKLLAKTKDSLAKAIIENSKIIPDGIIKWKERIIHSQLEGVYKDSIDILMDSALKQHLKIDSLIFANRNFISVPRTFIATDNKWISVTGTVKKEGVTLDMVDINLEPTVVFGETKNRILGIPVGRPTISAAIGDVNPHATFTAPQVHLYKPKESKIGATVGPAAIFDGKQFRYGAGIVVGYKIF